MVSNTQIYAKETEKLTHLEGEMCENDPEMYTAVYSCV